MLSSKVTFNTKNGIVLLNLKVEEQIIQIPDFIAIKSPVLSNYMNEGNTEAFCLNYTPEIVHMFLDFLSNTAMFDPKIKKICGELGVDIPEPEYISIGTKYFVVQFPYEIAKRSLKLVDWYEKNGDQVFVINTDITEIEFHDFIDRLSTSNRPSDEYCYPSTYEIEKPLMDQLGFISNYGNFVGYDKIHSDLMKFAKNISL
jgi:hypothetical protein